VLAHVNGCLPSVSHYKHDHSDAATMFRKCVMTNTRPSAMNHTGTS
jgi:hypothetical protein